MPSGLKPREDFAGRKFGEWTVIRRDTAIGWLCKCACGTQRHLSTYQLLNRKSVRCRQCSPSNRRSHGMTGTTIYQRWQGMLRRCYNPNERIYKYYGGRGVTVCDEWHRFEPFHVWAVSHGFSPNLTIERKDSNGDYSPENCCWIPFVDQWRSKRNALLVEYKGERIALADLSKRLRLDYNRLYRAIFIHGRPTDKAVAACSLLSNSSLKDGDEAISIGGAV